MENEKLNDIEKTTKKNKVAYLFSKKSIKIILGVIVGLIILNVLLSIGKGLANEQNYKNSNIYNNLSNFNTYGDVYDKGGMSTVVDGISSMFSSDSMSSMTMDSVEAPANGGSEGYYESGNSENLSTSNSVVENESKSEKLVHSANIDMETKNLTSALDFIHAKIESVEGIIQAESVNGNNRLDSYSYSYYNYSVPSANIYVRIPQKNYESFINTLNQKTDNLAAISIDKTVDNMTEVYYDSESRLKSLRVQEKRLLEFMENAENVSDMLSVESKLSEVQYQIDSVTNSLKTIDNDVQYAKVKIIITEVCKYTEVTENPTNFFERVIDYIKNSFVSFTENAEEILEAVIYLIPYGIIIGIIVVIVRACLKKKKLKREKKLESEDSSNSIK